jgi:anti-sigma B factor antagonist
MIEPEELRFDLVDGNAVVRLSGEIDLSNAARIKRSILEAISNQELKVVLDLQAVGYLDSAGIGMLFDLARRLAQHGQQMILVLPEASPIRRSLWLSGWPSDVSMVDTMEEVRLEG